MQINRLERLPGDAIAPLPVPKASPTEWTIPGYTSDSSMVRWSFGGLGFLIALQFVVLMGFTWMGLKQGWSIVVVVLMGLIFTAYTVWKLAQWQRHLRVNLARWVKPGVIEIPAYPLRLGERYSFTCHQTLMPRKPLTQAATWRIQLVCAETVTYGDATRPSHARWILHRETIHEQSIPVGSSCDLSTQSQFTLPQTGLPSFEGEYNRIRWQLESTVEVEGLPMRDLSLHSSSSGLFTARPNMGQPEATTTVFITRHSEFVLWVDPK